MEQVYLLYYPSLHFKIISNTTLQPLSDSTTALFTLRCMVYLLSFQFSDSTQIQEYNDLENIGIFSLNQTFQFELVQEVKNLGLKNHLSINGKMVAIPFHA